MSLLTKQNKFFYGATDHKYVPPEPEKVRKRKSSLDSYKFKVPDVLRGRTKVPLREVPLRFRTSPDDLVELAAKVVDKEPTPAQFEWDNLRIRHWIKDLGFPQYMVSFLRYY